MALRVAGRGGAGPPAAYNPEPTLRETLVQRSRAVSVACRRFGMIAALLVPAPAALAAAPPRPVAGWIDAIRYIGDQYYVFGWACQQGNRGAIDITVFGDKAPVVIGKADMENEPAVDRACGDADGGKHRFKIERPTSFCAAFRGKRSMRTGSPMAATSTPRSASP